MTIMAFESAHRPPMRVECVEHHSDEFYVQPLDQYFLAVGATRANRIVELVSSSAHEFQC